VTLAAVGAVLSLVIIVALLSGRPPPPQPNTTNDATNLVSNDADNTVNDADAEANDTSSQTADTNAVFDPSGPNPLVANNPIPGLLDASTMNANAAAAAKSGDLVTAAEWWSLSASKGDADGEAGLGVAYALGNGVKMNDEAAFDLFQKSANQGNVLGEHWEAAYYANGYGSTPVNTVMARYWYQRAAAQGDAAASDWLSKNPG
jgi:TPR repeat protein